MAHGKFYIHLLISCLKALYGSLFLICLVSCRRRVSPRRSTLQRDGKTFLEANPGKHTEISYALTSRLGLTVGRVLDQRDSQSQLRSGRKEGSHKTPW